MNEKQLARYKVGRQFYQDHLSAISLYQKLPAADEYLGFTDAAVAGYLDMLSDDIRTIQERSIVPPSGWHRITDFCPPGMQIASPGGLSFDLNSIASLSASEDASNGHLTINYKNGGTTKLTFHRNVDGGPPAIYGLKRKIEEAIKVLNTPAVFVKPDMLDHRAADGTLLGRVKGDSNVVGGGEARYSAYGPGSITDAATYEAPLGPVQRDRYEPGMDAAQEAERRIKERRDQNKYNEGWNAAIDHILSVSEKWMYHTGGEDPPYHRRCVDDEKRRQLLMLKRE